MHPAFDPQFREDLAALLAWRRDVRHFRPDPLDDATVLHLLSTAQLAPSVGNSQPWRFVRVRSASLRRALADHADTGAAQAGDAAYEGERRAAYTALKLHALDHAPEVIAVFCDEDTPIGMGLGAATMPQTRAWSVVMAIHTLWLAARAQGLGVGWVSIVKPETVAQLLATPPEWRLVALLCLGYPQEPDVVPELERRGWQARLDRSAYVSEV